MPCSKCKQSGHNARSCKNDTNVQETTQPSGDDLDVVVHEHDQDDVDEVSSNTKTTKVLLLFFGPAQ